MFPRDYILAHTFSDFSGGSTCHRPDIQHREKDCATCEYYKDCACIVKKLTLEDKDAQKESCAEISKSIKNGTVVAVFHADWSKNSKDVLDLISGIESAAKIVAVDVEKNLQVAKDKEIRFLPKVIIFKNGVEQVRFIGAKTKEEYIKAIERCK